MWENIQQSTVNCRYGLYHNYIRAILVFVKRSYLSNSTKVQQYFSDKSSQKEVIVERPKIEKVVCEKGHFKLDTVKFQPVVPRNNDCNKNGCWDFPNLR